eukprot:TRINITY_DN1416_c0_g1_i1.p3 TRINITY_DN1416_c0_g1~~TRINITY_DN1416_c0_g1_i1.p3  ORF type:complete len:128 (+),score=43.94 TRINITY_DN1416_c0_g1_i1:1397-1780(+)
MSSLRLFTNVTRGASSRVVLPSISASNSTLLSNLSTPSYDFRGFASGLDRSSVEERVLNVVKGFQKVDPGKVAAEAHFTKDLGLDSLDVVELVLALEEEFATELPEEVAEKIQSVEDAVEQFLTQGH